MYGISAKHLDIEDYFNSMNDLGEFMRSHKALGSLWGKVRNHDYSREDHVELVDGKVVVVRDIDSLVVKDVHYINQDGAGCTEKFVFFRKEKSGDWTFIPPGFSDYQSIPDSATPKSLVGKEELFRHLCRSITRNFSNGFYFGKQDQDPIDWAERAEAEQEARWDKELLGDTFKIN